jgi:hypothetical protein
MGFRSKNDERTPRTMAFANPSVGKKCVLLLQDDPGFTGPATRLTTTNRLSTASVDSKFEADDSFGDASFVEDIPACLNHRFNFATSSEIDMIADAKVLFKFRCITGTVPEVNIGRRGFESSGKATHRFATLSENRQIVIDVVPIIERNMMIGWLGSPHLGWDVDHKGTAQSGGIGRRSARDETVLDKGCDAVRK